MSNVEQSTRESAIKVTDESELDYWVNREARPILARVRDWLNRSFGSSTNVTASDYVGAGTGRIRVDATDGPVTIVLRPSAEAVTGVRELVIKKLDSSPNAVVVEVMLDSGDDIDGVEYYTIATPFGGLRLMPREDGYDIVG